jgi:hypothetical protein
LACRLAANGRASSNATGATRTIGGIDEGIDLDVAARINDVLGDDRTGALSACRTNLPLGAFRIDCTAIAALAVDTANLLALAGSWVLGAISFDFELTDQPGITLDAALLTGTIAVGFALVVTARKCTNERVTAVGIEGAALGKTGSLDPLFVTAAAGPDGAPTQGRQKHELSQLTTT